MNIYNINGSFPAIDFKQNESSPEIPHYFKEKLAHFQRGQNCLEAALWLKEEEQKLPFSAYDFAWKEGWLELCLLLSAQLDCEVLKEENRAYFYWQAIHNGNVFLLQALLKKGGEASKQIGGLSSVLAKHPLMPLVQTQGMSGLHAAILFGHLNCVPLLTSIPDACLSQDNQGLTPLHYATQRGDTALIDLLLQAGANINACTKTGVTILHQAILDEQITLIPFLLQKGAHLEQADYQGFTPLQLAVLKNNVAIIDSLIAAGASLNGRSALGLNPLHLAVKINHVLCAHYLIEKGARLDVPTQGGHEPLMLALKERQWQIVQLLLSYPQLKNREEKGLLWLLFSLDYNQEEMQLALKLFLAAEPNLWRQDLEGYSAIITAYTQDKRLFTAALNAVLQEKGQPLEALLDSDQIMKILAYLSRKQRPLPPELPPLNLKSARQGDIWRQCLAKPAIASNLCLNHLPLIQNELLQEKRLDRLQALPLKVQLNLLQAFSPSLIRDTVAQLSAKQRLKILNSTCYVDKRQMSAIAVLERLQQLQSEIGEAGNQDEILLLYAAYLNRHLSVKMLVAAFIDPLWQPLILLFFKKLYPERQQVLVPLFDRQAFSALVREEGGESFLKMATLEQKLHFLESNGLETVLAPLDQITVPGELHQLLQKVSQKEGKEELSSLKSVFKRLKKRLPHALNRAILALDQGCNQLEQGETSAELQQKAFVQKASIAGKIEFLSQTFSRLKEEWERAKLPTLAPSPKIPSEFCCPITLKVMENPHYYISYGMQRTLDKSTIDQLKGNQEFFLCPYSRQQVFNSEPALDLKERITSYLKL